MKPRNSSELGDLASSLLAIEEWLRDHCEARHADVMADVIKDAYRIIDDLYDEAVSRET